MYSQISRTKENKINMLLERLKKYKKQLVFKKTVLIWKTVNKVSGRNKSIYKY